MIFCSDFLATMPRELRPGMEYHVDISYPTPPRSQVTVYARIRQLNTETSPFAWSQPANSAGEVVSKYQTLTAKCHYCNDPKLSDRYAWANSADPDQTAPRGAV